MKKLLYFTIMSCFFSVGMVFTAQDNRLPASPVNRVTTVDLWSGHASLNLELGLRQEILVLRSRLDELNAIASSLGQHIHFLESNLSSRDQNQAYLEHQLQFEQRNLQQVIQDLVQTRNELGLQAEELNRQTKEVERLKETANRFESENAELAATYSRLFNQYNKIKSELDGVQQRLPQQPGGHGQTDRDLQTHFLTGVVLGVLGSAWGYSVLTSDAIQNKCLVQ